MSFQEHLTQMSAQRQQALAQQHQQRQAIVAQWKPIVYQLLQALGENTWGKDRYTIIEPEQSTTWTVVNFKGSRNSQFYVVIDFELIDIGAILAAGDSLPSQVAKAIGFRVIGESTFHADLSQPELERALIAALQKGANQEPLPVEITTALSRFPYQVGEYDQRAWWKSAIMWLAGPVTVIIGLWLISDPFSAHGVPYQVLGFLVGIFSLAGGIWAVLKTKFGRRYNKLPLIEKLGATLALLPGVFVTFVLAISLVVFVAGAAAEARKSEVRQAIHDELREHGL